MKPATRNKKPPKGTKNASAYESHKANVAIRQAEQSKAGRDIGNIPAVVNPERRAQASKSLEFYLRTYFAETFPLPWSNDHREVIAAIQSHAMDGGLDAYAMPRGGGKTSIAERAALWAVSFGYRNYVPIVGADETAAGKLLDTVKTELESNAMLGEDFPEIAYPIKRLERIAGRCHGQTCKGDPTFIVWTANIIVLPTVKGSAASGAIIEVRGITGGIRGMKFTRPNDGKSVRPDFVLIDDAQTDESSRSPSQCAERVRTIRKAVLGLAGPGKRIAGVLTATVINPGDMADQLLDRQKHPEWHGKRMKMLYAMPTNGALWEQYQKIRADSMRAGNGQKAATDFYVANREAMDAGAIVAWPARHDPEEVSALQNAMNLKADMGDAAFASEYQNEPLTPESEASEYITADGICQKINNLDRGLVAKEATKLVAFIDVQKSALPWAVVAVEDDFTGYGVDYGFYPKQPKDYFSLASIKKTIASVLGTKSLEETIYQGLDRLTEELLGKEWPREGGGVARIDRCCVDANWGESTDVVYQFCKESRFASQLVPTHGLFVGATSRPFNQYKPKRGDEVGDHWRRPLASNKRSIRYGLFDANFFKSFLFERLAVPIGGRGCFSLFGSDPQKHRLLADHLKAEEPVPVTAKGRTVTEFKILPQRSDNHLLDCLTGCMVSASMLRISLKERQQTLPAARKHVSFREMAMKANGGATK